MYNTRQKAAERKLNQGEVGTPSKINKISDQSILHSKSTGRKKTGPKVFRMLQEDKKEELILRWLQTSKEITRSRESVNTSQQKISTSDIQSDAIEEQQSKLQHVGVNATAVLNNGIKAPACNKRSTSTQSLNSFKQDEARGVWYPEESQSTMSCQVINTGRQPKHGKFKQLMNKLSHDGRSEDSDYKSVSASREWAKSQSTVSEAEHDHAQTARQQNNQNVDDNAEITVEANCENTEPTGQEEENVRVPEKNGEVDGDRSEDPESMTANFKVLEEFKERLDNDDKTVVYDMFELLLTKMTSVQENIKEVKEKQQKVSEKVSIIEKAIDFYAQSLEEIDVDLDDVTNTNLKLLQATIKCEAEIIKTQEQTKVLTKNVNKGTFLIHGLILKENANCKVQVETFLHKVVKTSEEVEVVSAHVIGKKANSPIWFKVLDPDHVANILSNTSNLKDVKNEKGNAYRIHPYMTEEERETRFRQQDIMADNRRLPLSHQSTMITSKGELTIDGQKYQKSIRCPQLKQTLLLDNNKQKSIEEAGIHIGSMKTLNDSTFYAYMAEANSMDEIKDAYQIIKNEHISATHIVCGYRLFNRNIHTYQDYSDDGETFAGKAVLSTIREANVWNVAVFVVRYHEGPNLGNLRPKIYLLLLTESRYSVCRHLPTHRFSVCPYTAIQPITWGKSTLLSKASNPSGL